MPHFDDLTPQETADMLDAMFPPGSNARQILDSTPPGERAAMDQAFARFRDREAERKFRDDLFHLMDPEGWEREQAERRRSEAEIEAAIDAITPEQWDALEADLRETERMILRERGIEPQE